MIAVSKLFTASFAAQLLGLAAVAFLNFGCTQDSLQGCEGPQIGSDAFSARTGIMLTGPQAALVLPNPIDATGIATATVSTAEVLNKSQLLQLADLTSIAALENNFLKVRIETQTDTSSMLAKPDASGKYLFALTDVHYWEVMAYQSVQSMRRYLKALGFALDESRPLYVTVRTKQAGVAADEVNAYYSHNYQNPSAPRTIKLFGNTSHAPGQDRLVYWHEFGHYINESVSKQVGMDYAGDSGAVYTEGSALHECLADYIAESVSDTSHIGSWISANFEGYSAGQPLRSAVDAQGQKLTFSQVGLSDGRGTKPERYAVAEWCTRVLWDIRKSFVTESSSKGMAKADMLMVGALSLLQKDTSISKYRDAVLQADQILYCGGHQSTIDSAFKNRGFTNGQTLNAPLGMQATIYGVNASGQLTSSVAAGQDFTFKLKITNSNGATARNVRVRIESSDARIYGTTYEQGYGDIAGGKVIDVGATNGLPLENSVFGMVDRTAASGSRLTYQLRLISENAPETVLSGEIQL